MTKTNTRPINISGAILAGGKSSRMGVPKCFVTVGGKSILDRVLEVFHAVFDKIFIVTDDKRRFSGFRDIDVVEDVIRHKGPLAGIYTGLKVAGHEKVFFTACDMPFLHIGLIERQLIASLDDRFDCVIPLSDSGVEPLHAVYSKRVLTEIEKSLACGELSVAAMLERCKCKFIEAKPHELISFHNINTLEDLKETQSHEGGCRKNK